MLRNILYINNPVLRKKSDPVDKINNNVRSFIEDLSETMLHENGKGLSAPQVGVSRNIIVVENGNKAIKLINPVIIKSYGSRSMLEGCLSIPHIYGKVNRPQEIIVKASDEFGHIVQLEEKGFLARVISHEIDHLDGILFIDKIIPGTVINREYMVSQGGKDDLEGKISLRL